MITPPQRKCWPAGRRSTASSSFPPWGSRLWRSGAPSGRFGLCRSASTLSTRHVRGPGAGVDVRAEAPNFIFVSLVSTLVAWVIGSSASQVRSLGTGVCVAEVWMSERRLRERLPCC
jgi:hypothetical protein